MSVSEFIEDLQAKTLIYIENENWERVNQIYQICPRQILFFKKKVEKKIQEFLDKSQNPFEQKKYDHENKGNFFQFRKPFKLVFIILRENRKFINKDLRKNICSNILNAIPIQLKKGTIFGLQDYFNAFYLELIEFHYDDLVNFPRILDYILKIDSNLIVDLFPEIIDKGYYEFGHTLIIEHPEIISNKEDDVKSLLMNLVVYEKQYEVLVDHLNTYNPKLIQILEESRVKLKNEYFDKLMHSQKGHIDDSLFKYENKVFRHTFDLFSDDELIKIINKFIDLEIMVSHYGESEREQRWTNILLLHISWNGKSYLFKDFIKDLVKLGYLQLVEGYFSQHPNEIKVNQKLILEKMDSFGLDLLSKKYESFDINDPVKLFKKLIYETLHYDNIIIRTFFSRNTDLIKEFKEILINYVEDYDFSYTENLQAVYYKIEHLLRYIYSDYPQYTPKLKIFHIEKFLERISSEPEIAEVFRFSYNRIIPNNFNLIRKSLQVEILDYLIKNKLLSTIEFYLKINIKNFEAHIPRILKFEPEHDLQSEHFIKVLEFILKNEFIHQEIRNLTIHRLKSQVNCSRKVELYSFLGDLNMAFQVIQKLLNTEEVLPYMINLYIDHQLIEIELSIEKSKNLPLNELIKEIAELEVLFNKFNTSQSLKPNFLFKLASYKARLFLYKGFEYINDYDYSISAKTFKESSELYYRLMNSPKIRNDTKSMFKTYWIIADFFSRRINSIKIFRGNDITKLNSFIEEHLLELTHELLKSNLQHQRIADMIKKIQFDPDNSLINQLKCEIPTKFCSIRPVVLFKRLFDDGNEILFEWDKDDESKLIDVIIMLQGWRRFYLEVEFTENQRYYDFELEAKEKGFFEIKDIEKKPPQSGKVIFEFRLKLEEFIGEDTLEFKLTESDICGYEIDVNIPIVFENVTRNFHKQDIKKVLKNQPTLAEL